MTAVGRRRLIAAVWLVAACGDPEPRAPHGPHPFAVATETSPAASSAAHPASGEPTRPAPASVETETSPGETEAPRRTECWPDACLWRMNEIVAPRTLASALGLPDPDGEPLASDLPLWTSASGLDSIPPGCAIDATEAHDCLGRWEVTVTGIVRPLGLCPVAEVDVRLVLVVDDEPARYGPVRHLESDFRTIGDAELERGCDAPPPSSDAIRAAITTEPELARALADALDLPTSPDERDRAVELELAFLRAARDRAQAAYRAGDHELAHDYVLAALLQPAVLTDAPGTFERSDGYALGCTSPPRLPGCTTLPGTRGTTVLLDDLVYFAVESGAGERTESFVEILGRIVELEPERPAARLNHADALWRTGRYREAVAEYERYLALRDDRVPARVRERIAMREPPRDPVPEALDDGRSRMVLAVGALAGGDVSVETTCRDATSGHHECTIVVRHRAGEIVHEAALMEEETTPAAPGAVSAAIADGVIEVRYPNADRFQPSSDAVERWTYRESSGFERLSTTEEPGWAASELARFHRVVRAGDLEQAWGIRAALGDTIDGYSTIVDDAEWSMFEARRVLAGRLGGDDAGMILRYAVESLARARAEADNWPNAEERIEGDRATSVDAVIRALRGLGGPANAAAVDQLDRWPVIRRSE